MKITFDLNIWHGGSLDQLQRSEFKAVSDGRLRPRPVITPPAAPLNQTVCCQMLAATCGRLDITQAGCDWSIVDDHCRRSTV